MADFLAVGRARRGALHGEVIYDDGDIAPVDARETGELAVGLRLRFLLRIHARRAEQARLDKTAFVDQCGNALARIEHAGLRAPRVFVRTAAGERARAPCRVFVE